MPQISVEMALWTQIVRNLLAGRFADVAPLLLDPQASIYSAPDYYLVPLLNAAMLQVGMGGLHART